jgi:hypothetical protein
VEAGMATEEVEVAISPSGEVTIKVSGVGGNRCLATTADLERALGGEVVERRMTSEAYARQAEQQSAWNRASW